MKQFLLSHDFREKRGVAIACFACILIGVFVGVLAGILWFVFSLFALHRWNPQGLAVLALISLGLSLLLLVLGWKNLAEYTSVLVYYFLLMMVAMQIIFLSSDTKKSSHDA